jgi:hypothetical protein
MRHLSNTAALLTIAAVVAVPSAARAARTLSTDTAQTIAFNQAIRDEKATPNTAGSQWLAPETHCSRRAGTWVVCRYTIGEITSGRVNRTCKRTIDVRLKARRPAPVVTRHPLICKS